MKNYFSHDYNARNDIKLQKVLFEMKLEWIWLYWCIIEIMFENWWTIKFSECESIAYALHTDCERIKKLISEYNLFQVDWDIISSKSVSKRIELMQEKSEKAKFSASKRRNSNNANALQTHSERNAIKEKEKEIKENIKENTNIKISNDITKSDDFENKKRTDIDLFISDLKNLCKENWIAFDKKRDRQFAKHILDWKDFWNFCETVWQDRITFAKNILIASIKINYYKWICSWPMSIYQNYSDVYNKTKLEWKKHKEQARVAFIPWMYDNE